MFRGCGNIFVFEDFFKTGKIFVIFREIGSKIMEQREEVKKFQNLFGLAKYLKI